jgi:hypothetical protein
MLVGKLSGKSCSGTPHGPFEKCADFSSPKYITGTVRCRILLHLPGKRNPGI